MRVYYFGSNLTKIFKINKYFLLYDTGKLCSKFGEDRSINNVTILSTDTEMDGGTDGRLHDFIFSRMLCIARDRQKR